MGFGGIALSMSSHEPIAEKLIKAAIGDKTVREAYQKALGALAISFSLLHFHLEVFSWDVFGVDHQTGQILTKDLPTKQLVQKLRLCSNHRAIQEKDRKDFHRILKQVETAAEQRNELLHDLWLIHEGQPVFCYKRRGRSGKVPAPSLSDIHSSNRTIQALTVKLIDFKERAPISIPSFIGIGHPIEEIAKSRKA